MQIRDQRTGQQNRAQMRTIAEFQYRGDQTDDQGGEQFQDMMMGRIVDITHDEAKIQRQGQQHEKPEQHLFQIHPVELPSTCTVRIVL